MDSGINQPTPEQVLEWIKGTDDGVTREGLNMPIEGSRWYLIPMSFLTSWKAAFGLESAETVSELVINNSLFLSAEPGVLALKSEVVLKAGLRLGVDYEIVPPKAWEYFRNAFQVLDDLAIECKSIAINELETQVEVSLKPIKVAVIAKDGDLLTPQPQTMFVSHVALVSDVKQKLSKVLSEKGHVATTAALRLYELAAAFTFEDIQDKFPLKPGTVLPVSELNGWDSLEDSKLADEDVILAEIKDTCQSSKVCIATVHAPFDCAYCFTSVSFGIQCSCKDNSYCSKLCLSKDLTHHTCRSSYYNTYNREYAPPARSTASLLGRVGLQNLGNTCFMSAGLQCLSNTTFLTEFMLNDRYLADLNEDNPLGTGGKLVKEYANLLKELWHGSSSSVSPWRFKSALSQFARQFSGYQQHDSQEMLSFLLDGLHEDLNRVKKKPYIEELQLAGLSEAQMAERFWEAHLLRNQSVIVENMHGQYRSEVTCPQCNHTSLNFDPFLMITLQIPRRDHRDVSLQFVPLQGPPRRLRVRVPKSSGIKGIREAAIEVTNSDVLIASVSANTSLEKVYSDLDPYVKYRSLYAYEVPASTEDEIMVILQVYKEVEFSYNTSKTSLTHPRLLFLNQSSTVEELYSTLFLLFKEVFGEQQFTDCFPEFHQSDGLNAFKVNLVNPHRSYYCSVYARECPFCLKKQCTNCELPYAEESLQSYEAKVHGPLKLEVIFSKHVPASELAALSHLEKELTPQKPQEPVTIYDCMACSSQREQLDASNTTYCSNCKDHVRGFKKMDLYKLNRWLVFHIKRFKQEGYFSSRNNRIVDFPITGLEMAPYCLTAAGVYDLYAVSNHYGSLGGGHYTAYALNNGQWFEYDDSRVSPVRDESQIASESSYVLFYRLRE